jgi:hypothetical protein
MQSNHTLLTIGAFIILMTVLQGFYRILWSSSDDVADAQDMILATTIATSYLEVAQGLAFDEVTDTSHVGVGNASLLTPVSSLGKDGSAEDSIAAFNDFDDFNGLMVEKQATGTNKRFTTVFHVYYVDPNNMDKISTTRTFMKRLDLVSWRSYPPHAGTAMDTLRLSVGMGYFHFD